jgi:predicted membrane channel-forming protein YqfA (hemolysin III family)
METKEHLVIVLLLLATYLPVVAANNLAESKDARKLMLWLTATIAVFALVMDGEGALIAMGVKMGLLAK